LKTADELLRIATARLKTTMVGAISDLEDVLGPDLDPALFAELRERAFNRGNAQIRALKADFDSSRAAGSEGH
jgi:hypothetical protein